MYYNNQDIRLEEMPTPRIRPSELLVKIHSSGICGSYVLEWYRKDKAPMVLGHEIAGEIVELGKGIEGFRVGDRVTATHHVPCFRCHFCLNGHETACDTLMSGTHFDPGGFCEYVRLPKINVDRGTWKIPEDVSYDEATFVEPLACVLRGQRRVGMEPAKSVLVLGSGISGILHIILAKSLGASRIIASDVTEYRRVAAQRFGADHTLRADQDIPTFFRKLNGGIGADIVIVCTGAIKAIKQAMHTVESGGIILFFAPTIQGATIPLSINNLFWRRDITLTTTYAGAPADCVNALKLIRAKRIPVNDMITHHFGLAETVEGFKLVEQGNESIKVIIRPQE
jgi:L-iditol 2-dehydrogenase